VLWQIWSGRSRRGRPRGAGAARRQPPPRGYRTRERRPLPVAERAPVGPIPNPLSHVRDEPTGAPPAAPWTACTDPV